jgi:hypothetical protein
MLILLKWLHFVNCVDVLFQITNLRETFLTIPTNEGTATIVLAEVVPDIARLFKGYIAPFDQTFIIGSRFVRSLV